MVVVVVCCCRVLCTLGAFHGQRRHEAREETETGMGVSFVTSVVLVLVMLVVVVVVVLVVFCCFGLVWLWFSLFVCVCGGGVVFV